MRSPRAEGPKASDIFPFSPPPPPFFFRAQNSRRENPAFPLFSFPPSTFLSPTVFRSRVRPRSLPLEVLYPEWRGYRLIRWQAIVLLFFSLRARRASQKQIRTHRQFGEHNFFFPSFFPSSSPPFSLIDGFNQMLGRLGIVEYQVGEVSAKLFSLPFLFPLFPFASLDLKTGHRRSQLRKGGGGAGPPAPRAKFFPLSLLFLPPFSSPYAPADLFAKTRYR